MGGSSLSGLQPVRVGHQQRQVRSHQSSRVEMMSWAAQADRWWQDIRRQGPGNITAPRAAWIFPTGRTQEETVVRTPPDLRLETWGCNYTGLGEALPDEVNGEIWSSEQVERVRLASAKGANPIRVLSQVQKGATSAAELFYLHHNRSRNATIRSSGGAQCSTGQWTDGVEAVAGAIWGPAIQAANFLHGLLDMVGLHRRLARRKGYLGCWP